MRYTYISFSNNWIFDTKGLCTHQAYKCNVYEISMAKVEDILGCLLIREMLYKVFSGRLSFCLGKWFEHMRNNTWVRKDSPCIHPWRFRNLFEDDSAVSFVQDIKTSRILLFFTSKNAAKIRDEQRGRVSSDTIFLHTKYWVPTCKKLVSFHK